MVFAAKEDVFDQNADCSFLSHSINAEDSVDNTRGVVPKMGQVYSEQGNDEQKYHWPPKMWN